MMVGVMAGASGACPVCGKTVSRTHAFNGLTLTERYACARCGDSVYRAGRAARP